MQRDMQMSGTTCLVSVPNTVIMMNEFQELNNIAFPLSDCHPHSCCSQPFLA